jgi:hypothetical protein
MYIVRMNNDRLAELNRWRTEALAALDAAAKDLAEIQKRIKQNEQRVQLVDGLLALEGIPTKSTRNTSDSDVILDACDEIISANERPMHIRDLHAALLERGVVIPGKGTEANLIVRLQRSEGRFMRVGRGTYAPSSFQLPEKSPVRVKRLRSRKRSGHVR